MCNKSVLYIHVFEYIFFRSEFNNRVKALCLSLNIYVYFKVDGENRINDSRAKLLLLKNHFWHAFGQRNSKLQVFPPYPLTKIYGPTDAAQISVEDRNLAVF